MPDYYVVKWVPPTPLDKLEGPTITNRMTGTTRTMRKPPGPLCDVCAHPWPDQPAGTLIASVEDCYVTQTYVPTGVQQEASPPWAVCPRCCLELELGDGQDLVQQRSFQKLMHRYIGANADWGLSFRVGPIKAEPS